MVDPTKCLDEQEEGERMEADQNAEEYADHEDSEEYA
jgi:hypothetical protein